MAEDQTGGEGQSLSAQSPGLASAEAVAEPAGSALTRSSTYKWFALGILFIVYIFNFVDRQIFAILQEEIKADLNLTDTQLGFLGGFAFAVFYTTLGLPIARLADKTNRSRIIATALAIWSGMTALCGMATGFFTLALARIGVGIGEAGCSPPAHSLISDLFPQEQRSTALGIYSMGIPIGVALGYLFGGYINELFGWRQAFLMVGLPGLAFSLVVVFFLREPPRGQSDGLSAEAQTGPTVPMGEVIRNLWNSPAFRHLSFAAALHSFVSYGVGQWIPSFFIRNWGVSTGDLALALGLISLTFGAVSAFAGGWLSDRFGTEDKRWYCWVPAITILLAMPFSILALFQGSWLVAIGFYSFAALFNGMYLGPTFSMTQGLVSLRMRALAAAVLLFVLNLIGLGLGPLVVGTLSDLFRDSLGTDSLKYALLITGFVNAWAAIHYMLASRTIRAELKATVVAT